MGDRANIHIHTDQWAEKRQPGIFLYTHWAGTELATTLRTALQRHERWDDLSYLTRIVFCEMVKGQEAEETGYGISTSHPDNEHQFIDVSVKDQTVSFCPEKDDEPDFENPSKVYTFQEYVDATEKEINRAYLGYDDEDEDDQN